MGYLVNPIGYVESTLLDRASAPRQGVGAPDAWLVMAPEYAEGLRNLQAGDQVMLLTWFDRADRTVLATRPRDDPANPLTGVFSTRPTGPTRSACTECGFWIGTACGCEWGRSKPWTGHQSLTSSRY